MSVHDRVNYEGKIYVSVGDERADVLLLARLKSEEVQAALDRTLKLYLDVDPTYKPESTAGKQHWADAAALRSLLVGGAP